MSETTPVKPSYSKAGLYHNPITPSLVRLFRDDGWGTGVVIGRRWMSSYVLTAAHVVRSQRTVRVSPFCFPHFVLAKGFVLARDRDVDLAILRFSFATDLPVIPLSPVVLIPAPGELCLCMTHDEEDRPLVVQTRCVKAKVFHTFPRRGLCLLTNRKGFPGRSESPLLARGFCIGICNGHVGDTGVYVSLQEIHPFLRRVRLPWLTTFAQKR